LWIVIDFCFRLFLTAIIYWNCFYIDNHTIRIYGHNGYDTITGGVGNDILKGQSGYDVIYGNSGMDVIDGGNETDRCYDSINDLIVNCE